MNRQLSRWTECSSPAAYVRLSGRLDAASGPAVRADLARAIGQRPGACVVDVARLTVAEPGAAALLADVARGAIEWPGVEILLCCPRAELVDALSQVANGSAPQCFATCGQAHEAANRQPPVPYVHTPLPDGRPAPSEARRVVGAACARWGVPELEATAQLLVSEMVSNAVVHAGTPVDLAVWRSEHRLHIAVHDRDRRQLSAPDRPADTDEHGRGLRLVDALATAWGTILRRDGKIVWAALRLQPDDTAPDGARTD